ncbi:MAG TPA: class I SAM-dependent methyltransferase, partial [Kiloniellales bacterium]
DDYERTLQVWHENFVRNWTNIRDSYDQRFFRMWTLYLLISQGIFRSRIAHVWQFVFAKEGYLGTAQEMERRREFCEAR